MKKILVLLLALMLLCCSTFTAFAADGKVIYDGKAQEFIFKPGSDNSPTDLFPEFKGVMPGDTLSQKINLKNDASNKVKVDIYIRSLGAHEDSEDFLSKLRLRVKLSEDNQMGYMFDAAADSTGQLSDWLCLGTLYSGGEVNLDVLLDVPTDLDNTYENLVGLLDWEFKVEEFPIESTDPTPPKTGDSMPLVPWIAVLLISVSVIILMLYSRRKKEKN